MCITDKIQKFGCAEIYGFISGCLRIRFCGFFFFQLWPSEFDNEIRMHISAYADICQHDVRDVHTGSLQSAGSCLWKLVAGKPDRASDLWPSTQIRITSSSSEAWLLLPNTPLWLLNNPCLVSLHSLNQKDPQVQALSAFPHSCPWSQTQPKRAWCSKDQNYG